MNNYEKQKKHDKRKITTEAAKITKPYFKHLVSLFEQTQNAMQSQAARSVDIALVVRNWLFGWYIIEFENGGADRAELYGKKLFEKLALRLKQSGLKGLSVTNLKLYRSFYESFKKIGQTVSDQSRIELQNIRQTLSGESQISQALSEDFSLTELNIQDLWQRLSVQFSLSWSHYVVLMTVKLEDEQRFYEIEAVENAWGIRELKRQINSSLYERLALSRDKEKVKELSEKGQLVNHPSDVLKSPYILEFLDLKEQDSYSEHELETAIIDKIEHFLLELGKGFLFEARQKRFTFNDDHFYVDLVFYNRLLRCYVIIDLKRDKLTHQDLGQMQMYVNYFDRYVKLDDEKLKFHRN